jgi:hypothetical protein
VHLEKLIHFSELDGLISIFTPTRRGISVRALAGCCNVCLSDLHATKLQNAAVDPKNIQCLRKKLKNQRHLIRSAQQVSSSSGTAAAEGSMCDSRAAPRSCSGSSSHVFACSVTVKNVYFH